MRNISVVKIRDTQVEQNIEEKRKIEQGIVGAIFNCTGGILHGAVDSQQPERFDQQVEKQQESQIGDKFFLHSGKVGANLTELIWEQLQSDE